MTVSNSAAPSNSDSLLIRLLSLCLRKTTTISPAFIRIIVHSIIGFTSIYNYHVHLPSIPRFRFMKRIMTFLSLFLILVGETYRRKRSDIPTVPCFGRGIWGHLVIMGWSNRHSRLDFACACARHVLDQFHSFTYSLAMPFISTFIMTSHPANLEYILKTNHQNFVKGRIFKRNHQVLLGHGIFNSDGDLWRIQRKSASHIFNVKNFRDHMFTIFAKNSSILGSRLNHVCSSHDPTVDLFEILHRFTLDSFMEIGFGASINSLDNPGAVPFAAAFDTAQDIVAVRMLRPHFLNKFVEFVSGKDRELARSMEIVDEFVEQIILARRQLLMSQPEPEFDSDHVGHSDLLTIFMLMRNPETDTHFSDRELRDFVINFIIAGRDTTAQAISWTVYVLTKHPLVVQKIRAEINLHLGTEFVMKDNVLQLEPTIENYTAITQNLVYTKAAFSEALRLYPSVPIEAKVAVQDDELPDGTKVSAGDRLVWCLYAMGRLEEIWGPDAKEYKPQRWIDEHGHFIQHDSFRKCLGQQVAYLEGILCLITLLHNFDFELVNDESVQYKMSLTLSMKNGLPVRVSRNCSL